MKTKLFLFVFLALSLGIRAQIVNIPDATFKSVLLSSANHNYIAKNLAGNYFAIDANNDGQIQWSEAQQVSYIRADYYNTILSLEGIKNFTNLQVLICGNNWNLASLDVENMVNLQELQCGGGQMTTLNVQGCTSLKTLYCGSNMLTSLNVQGLINLEDLRCMKNKITALNVQGLTNLKKLYCGENLITSLNVQGLTQLIHLFCGQNQLTSLNVQGLTQLIYLYFEQNQISSMDFQGLNNLEESHCDGNQLSSIDVHNLTNLKYFICGYNPLTSLNVQGCNNLLFLSCDNASLDSLNVQGLSKLEDLRCENNQITNLNLQTLIKLINIDCSYNNLYYLFAKNGKNEYLNFSNNPNLKYICCDEDQIDDVEYQIFQSGYNNCTANTYCSFIPGGNYNTITGTVKFDENNNGCDVNDEIFEHMKLKIDDGNAIVETFVKPNGKYDFYTQAGDFTVTAEPENPSLFTVTPSTFVINFADSNNNLSTQNICVAKNGNVKDLEVVFAPVTDARPGFDAVYKLIWRNKGNTTLSGNVTLTFDNTKMIFLSSVLPSTVNGNQITFSFTNLKPYANTSSELTFNVNPPTHPTNPVNIGNIFDFNAIINSPSGESTPEDNEFAFKQTVVGSFDPNDITCLEGSQIPVSMVGKYLHYIINFENTGTAPATNIVVEMNVNPDDFDVSSLQLQNTSHSTYTKVTGNKVEFIMKDINLAALAHGNVALKIKSNNNLITGDSVSNQANIYFDYNFPVETNEAITLIKNPTLQTNDTISNNSINIYPNPTKDDVNISTDAKIKSIEVYDAQGRIIQKHMGINSQHAKVSIRSNTSGLYIFKIITEKEVVMKKVMKN